MLTSPVLSLVTCHSSLVTVLLEPDTSNLEPLLGGIMETLWQDLRYGFRMLAKDRGFTVVAVVMLPLGIGANSAIFIVLNGVLFGSLPVMDADPLVVFSGGNSHRGR